MPPSIDIDDETFDFLKKHAEPFVDTPGSVLRRLLGLARPDQSPGAPDSGPQGSSRASSGDRGSAVSKSRGRRGKRAARGSLLPEAEYEIPILRYLADHEGRAPSREVVEGVGKMLSGKFTTTDRETLNSGDVRWKNRVAFVRLRLIEKGELNGQAPRGTWEITDKGSQRLAAR